jgi:hypothetical protein
MYTSHTKILCHCANITDFPLASNDVKLEKVATAKFEVFIAKHPERPVLKVGINLLKTERNLLYIRNQSVPRCRHFPPRL